MKHLATKKKKKAIANSASHFKRAVCLLPPLLLAAVLYLQFQTATGLFSSVSRIVSQPAAIDDLVDRLRASATFLPLKDTRERSETWFISTLDDVSEPDGEAKNGHCRFTGARKFRCVRSISDRPTWAPQRSHSSSLIAYVCSTWATPIPPNGIGPRRRSRGSRLAGVVAWAAARRGTRTHRCSPRTAPAPALSPGGRLGLRSPEYSPAPALPRAAPSPRSTPALALSPEGRSGRRSPGCRRSCGRPSCELFLAVQLTVAHKLNIAAKNLVFPSAASAGRLLCLAAPSHHDGTRNAYALAWRDALPHGAALRPGLAFVSETAYDHSNIWHGLTALIPFASWHARSGCRARPARWALFHHGEVRAGMSRWLTVLAEAATGANMTVETFDAPGPVCFEEAVVFRRNLEGLSRERLLGAFDFMRCKARAYCGVDASSTDPTALRVTLLFRSGGRAFKDEAAVTRVFREVCARVNGCTVATAHSDNVTFCDQVRLLSATDVLISAHGAQMTNLMFMDRNSSIMEFYPMGWRQSMKQTGPRSLPSPLLQPYPRPFSRRRRTFSPAFHHRPPPTAAAASSSSPSRRPLPHRRNPSSAVGELVPRPDLARPPPPPPGP